MLHCTDTILQHGVVCLCRNSFLTSAENLMCNKGCSISLVKCVSQGSFRVNKSLLFFSRELLEQVAEFEKSEFTSSNKKVEFCFNQIIKCHVELWEVFKVVLFVLKRENQPLPLFQSNLWVSKKQHSAVQHQGLHWVALAVAIWQLLPQSSSQSQTRAVPEHLLLGSLPPGNWGKTGTLQAWSQELGRFHNADVIPASLVWWWFVAGSYT